jgi:RNA polymerase sigma-70 factor, ECF subfamily
MAQLPDAQRLCLLLSVVGGFSSSEIANMLDLREATVRQRLTRARRQFQQLYARESGEVLLDGTTPVPESKRMTSDSARHPMEHGRIPGSEASNMVRWAAVS